MNNIEFIERYPIKTLIPADYNPRKLEEEKFEILKESLRKFGIVKPVIINGENGTLTAGHQRTRAMKAIGMEFCPAIRLRGITRADEITFNLFHNSVETNKSLVSVDQRNNAPSSFFWVDSDNIHYKKNDNALVVQAITLLMRRYGPWGSCIINENGEIIHNADYAVACKQMRLPCLCYMIKNSLEDELLAILKNDFGAYYYDALNIDGYNQYNAQLPRLAGKGKKKIISVLYENFVIDKLTKNETILDFGAGKCVYPNILRKQGYNIYSYEPNFSERGKLNVRETVRQIYALQKIINEKGLFDTVILDSVLNSVINKYFEHAVLTTCCALMKKNARFFCATRSMNYIHTSLKLKSMASDKRCIEFLDKDNFSITYRKGVWTMQHFHSHDTLESLLNEYFDEVVFLGSGNTYMWQVFCANPKPIGEEKLRDALNAEFNMEYPGGYRHNKHGALVDIIMQRNKEKFI